MIMLKNEIKVPVSWRKSAFERKIRRYKFIDVHRKLVKEGKLLEARKILYLLRDGSITLGLDDVSNAVERICEDFGCRVRYSRCFNLAEVRL